VDPTGGKKKKERKINTNTHHTTTEDKSFLHAKHNPEFITLIF